MKDIHDVIKRAKFGDDRLRVSGLVVGQILAFPIDFAGRPYNTLTLPCERVIYRYLAERAFRFVVGAFNAETFLTLHQALLDDRQRQLRLAQGLLQDSDVLLHPTTVTVTASSSRPGPHLAGEGLQLNRSYYYYYYFF